MKIRGNLCPDCNGPLEIDNPMKTDRYGTLIYATCPLCRTEFVREQRDPEWAEAATDNCQEEPNE